MNAQRTVCFSGYRPEKFSFILQKGHAAYFALRERTAAAILQAVEGGYTTFMCGMCKGFDLVAADVVLELREHWPELAGLKLIAVLPFEGQGFADPWQVMHQLVLGRADEVMTLAPAYRPGIYFQRNRYMVDHSSRLICYYDGRPGGTAHTVRYARQVDLEIINVAEAKSIR